MAHDLTNLPLTLKRHGKALVPTVLVGFIILFIMGAIFKFWPADWPYQWIVQVIFALTFFSLFLVPLMRWFTETFTISETAVRNDWGILYRQSREIDLTRIASISEERGILDRIFACGTLNFYDAAAGAQPNTSGLWNKGNNTLAGVRFHDVPNVKAVRDLVEAAKQNALQR